MLEKKAPALVSVVKTEHPPECSVRIGDNLKISELAVKLDRGKRRQDYPPTYRLNGAIYVAQSLYYLQKKTFITEDTIAFIMPPERSVDIDSRLDLRLAELIINDSD
jgi:CMP-N-acetylneuraminic acid synthetase